MTGTFLKSEWPDSNRRPLVPRTSALTYCATLRCVPPTRFELATSRSVVGHSTPLSYGGVAPAASSPTPRAFGYRLSGLSPLTSWRWGIDRNPSLFRAISPLVRQRRASTVNRQVVQLSGVEPPTSSLSATRPYRAGHSWIELCAETSRFELEPVLPGLP